MPNLQNFDLPADAYLGFDAQNVKELMIQRLIEGNVYTDQIFEGSNMSALLDVIAYTYHMLLFYLNRMGAETTFTQTQLYENMNRIVKLLSYNPVGYQTACVTFDASVNANISTLSSNHTYTIPRFSYIDVNGIRYTLTKDAIFALTESTKEEDIYKLTEFSKTNILFQGEIIEAPIYYPRGDQFETYTLIPNNISGKYVDFSNFSVYVYDNEEGWQEWTETSSLYLESNNAKKYEKRLNESGYYEFRFGNNVNGQQLSSGNLVQIYYLLSDGVAGEIGTNQLKDNTMNIYQTPIYRDICNNTLQSYITLSEIKSIIFDNKNSSTQFTLPESVDAIRNTAKKVFKSQSQLITNSDIKTYVERNFSNIVSSVWVCNNKQYIDEVLQYYNSLGVNSITKESRISYNQLQFSTSCNFNNVYVFMTPKFEPVTDQNVSQYVDTALKQHIVTQMENSKPLTTEIIPSDPVYIAISPGVRNPMDGLFTQQFTSQTPDDILAETKIVLTRVFNSHNKTSIIKSQAIDIIKEHFTNIQLGQTISPTEISNKLMTIEGIKSVQTKRNGVTVPGVSFMVWNPIYYNKDINITTDDIILNNFKYPFLYNKSKLADYIEVVVEG